MRKQASTAGRLLSDSYWLSGDRKRINENQYPLLQCSEFDLLASFGKHLAETYQRMKETAVIEKPLNRQMILPLIMGNIVSKKLLRVVIDERITRGPQYGGNGNTEDFDASAAAIERELDKRFEDQEWREGSQAVYSADINDNGYIIPTTIARSVYYAFRPEGQDALVGGLAANLEPYRFSNGRSVFRAIPPLAIDAVYEMPASGREEHLQRVISADKVEQTYYAAVSDEAMRFVDSLGKLLTPRPALGF